MIRKAAVTGGLVILALSLLPVSTRAQEKPFQLSLIGPTIQLVDDDADIKGLRINLIYGVNRNVTGLDLGIINHTNGDMAGVGFGLVNLTDGGFTGWQAGAVNVAREHFTGLQWSAWSGLALANFAGTGEGAQLAYGVNSVDYLSGFQLAIVNIAEDLHGLQIGLVNIIRSKDDFPILPIVNWKFD